MKWGVLGDWSIAPQKTPPAFGALKWHRLCSHFHSFRNVTFHLTAAPAPKGTMYIFAELTLFVSPIPTHTH